MKELQIGIAVILLLLAGLVAVVNWSCIIINARNSRKGIENHVSMVPLVSLILAGFAYEPYPWAPKWWVFIIPATDIGNWALIIGALWERAKGMFKKETRKNPCDDLPS